MRKSIALLVVSSACLFCVQAKASVVALSVGTTTSDFGPTTFTETFDNGQPVNNPANFSDAVATWASGGTAGANIVNGTGPNNAAPFFSPAADTTNYLAVFGGGTETIALKTGVVGSGFGLFIGSLDSYNNITFYDGGSTIATFSGSTIATLAGLTADGGQLNTNSNRYVEFTGLGPFTSVVLGSTSNSLEVDNVAINYSGSVQGAVPETSTWMMMILGFLAVGFTAYRRNPRGLSFRIA